MTHPLSEVVLDIEHFQIGCNSTAWLHASQSSPSKPLHTWQTQRAQYFTIIANRHSWSAELLRIWCYGPKEQRGQVSFRENSGTHGNNVYLSILSIVFSHWVFSQWKAWDGDWKFTGDDKFLLLHVVKARYWTSQRVLNQQTHCWLFTTRVESIWKAKKVNCLKAFRSLSKVHNLNHIHFWVPSNIWGSFGYSLFY